MTKMHIAAINGIADTVETSIQNGFSFWMSNLKNIKHFDLLIQFVYSRKNPPMKSVLVLTVRDFYIGAVAPLTPGAMIKSTAHLDHVYHPRSDAVQAEVCLCSRHVLLQSKKKNIIISCQFVCSLLSHKGSGSGNIFTKLDQ